MAKRTNRIPSALKRGIYTGIGPLPTEDPTEFENFKQEIFNDYKPVGRSEEIIVEEIACLEWRLRNLSTYGVAMRARNWHSSIHSTWNPPSPAWAFLSVPDEPEPRSPEEIEASRKNAEKQVRSELGPAIELVKIGDVATIDYLEKELAIRERLHGIIARLEKRLLFVRGIKSISSSSTAAPPQPLLEAAE